MPKSPLLDESLALVDVAATFAAIRNRVAEAGLRPSVVDVYIGASELQLTVVRAAPGVKRAEDWIALGRKQLSDQFGLDLSACQVSFSFLAGGGHALFAASPRANVEAIRAAMADGKHRLATAQAFPSMVASALGGRHRPFTALVVAEPGAVSAFSQIGDTRSADVMHIDDSAEGREHELSRRRLALPGDTGAVWLCCFDPHAAATGGHTRKRRTDWLDCLTESAL